MNRKKTILILILGLLLSGILYGWHEFYRQNPDMSQLKADFKTEAPGLLQEFDLNDSVATKKYLGKIVEVKGLVKKIERDDQQNITIVLGNSGNMSSVRCALDTVQKTVDAFCKEGSTATLKGICTGFNKDATGFLGSDVQLNRCIIHPDPNK